MSAAQQEVDLPNELMVYIFRLLDWPHLACTSLVSRSWHRLSLVVWQLQWQAAARPFLGPQATLPLLVCRQNARLADFDTDRCYARCLHKLANKDVVSLKVVLIGDTGVGKTTLLNRLMGQEEHKDKIPSTFSNFTIPTLYRDLKKPRPELVFVSLWDTEMWDTGRPHYDYYDFEEGKEKKRLKNVEAESNSSGEDYTRMRRLTYPWTDIFLLCFAVNSEQSLASLTTKWKEELDKWAPAHHVRVLCGLHADARDDDGAGNCVSSYTIKKAQKELAATAYIEASVTTSSTAQKVVEVCIDEMYKQRATPCRFNTFQEWTQGVHFYPRAPSTTDYAPLADKPFRYFSAKEKVAWYCGSFECNF